MKGSILDIMFGTVIMFVIAISLVVSMQFYNSVNASGMFAGNAQAQSAFAAGGQTLNLMDSVFMVIMLAIGLGGIISATLIRSHPIFFVIMLFVNAITWIITAVLSNAFTTFTGTGFATAANSFPYMALVLTNFPLIAIGLSFVVAILMFSKGGSA
jgi:hypothetical protein